MTVLLQQIVNGLMLGGVYVMVAVAFTLVIGMLNFLNFRVNLAAAIYRAPAWSIHKTLCATRNRTQTTGQMKNTITATSTLLTPYTLLC